MPRPGDCVRAIGSSWVAIPGLRKRRRDGGKIAQGEFTPGTVLR
jgi:hypothetical protein